MKAKGTLFSISFLLYLVFAFVTEAAAESIDIAHSYAAKKDAVVVVLAERDGNQEDIKQKDTKKTRLPYIMYAEKPNGLAVISAGSGFITREDGLVITAYHIVKDAKNVFVELLNGEVLEAEVLGFDARPLYDIAVLKIKANRIFPKLTITNERNPAFVGKELLLIGHPFLLRYTASLARISNLALNSENTEPVIIQIHSSVLPGNSGSPLIDSKGFVVGMVFASLGDSDTQGFATPFNLIQEVLNKVLAETKK